jgi:plastocyanin
MKVPAEKLRGLLGLTGVYYVENKHSLAVIDSPLLGLSEGAADNKQESKQREKTQPAGANEVNIDNFSFSPKELTVSPGTKVTWANHDDIPHTVVATEKQFASSVLDTDQSFSFMFKTPGVYDYYCSIHTHMVGKIIVK